MPSVHEAKLLSFEGGVAGKGLRLPLPFFIWRRAWNSSTGTHDVAKADDHELRTSSKPWTSWATWTFGLCMPGHGSSALRIRGHRARSAPFIVCNP
jgi:hypothetical protein